MVDPHLNSLQHFNNGIVTNNIAYDCTFIASKDLKMLMGHSPIGEEIGQLLKRRGEKIAVANKESSVNRKDILKSSGKIPMGVLRPREPTASHSHFQFSVRVPMASALSLTSTLLISNLGNSSKVDLTKAVQNSRHL